MAVWYAGLSNFCHGSYVPSRILPGGTINVYSVYTGWMDAILFGCAIWRLIEDEV